jgi:cytochrome c5
MNYKTLTVAISTLALTLLTASADEKKPDASKLPPASTATGVTYDKDIKPIFDKNCVKCHHGEKARAKLSLDSAAGAIKGGKEGPDIIVGKSGESGLVFAVAHVGDDDDFMPPTKKMKDGTTLTPLTPEQVGLIRAWIDQGCK